MPSIYLSPSAQEGTYYVTGQTEEQMMNRLADAVEADLVRAGVTYRRNSPEMSVNQIIRDSNQHPTDLHVALHSNAAPEGQYGRYRGIIAYYYPGSVEGKRAAEIMAENFRRIYPDPNLVRIKETRSLGELRYTKEPAVFLEIGYHDNTQDARWVAENIETIAETVTDGILQYLDDTEGRTAIVRTAGGTLNLRSLPSMEGKIIGSIPNGAVITATSRAGDWYRTQYLGEAGWVNVHYLQFS